MVSIIIPTNKDPYAQKTIDSLLENSQGKIELIVVLDGFIPEVRFKKDPRVKIINTIQKVGMRTAINTGLRMARGKFIMKCDCHCLFGPGYDKILSQNCKDNWLMIPRRYSLDELTFTRDESRPIRDYHYLTYPRPIGGYGICLSNQDWLARADGRNSPEYNIDDTMTFQGSCWFANRKYFMKRVGLLDDRAETYGTFADEPQEIGLKYWLGGGAVKVIKKTWYAHLSKQPRHYNSGIYSRQFKADRIASQARTWSAKHWIDNEEPGMIHPFSWLVEKFWPVPSWPEDKNLWKFSEVATKEARIPNEIYSPTLLCKIAMTYGCNKCPRLGYCYTPFYYDFFNDIKTKIIKVLEIGKGQIEPNTKTWRDFFPNALIYGTTTDKKYLFTDKNIQTFILDISNKKDIKSLTSIIGTDIDLVIDNSSKHIHHQMFLFKHLMPLLRKNTTYIVENCWRTRQIKNTFPKYNCYIPELLPNEIPIRGGLAVFTQKKIQ
jgi:glycosyltransferase involved in cell wall biosynthesis